MLSGISWIHLGKNVYNIYHVKDFEWGDGDGRICGEGGASSQPLFNLQNTATEMYPKHFLPDDWIRFVLRDVELISPLSGIHCGHVNNPSKFILSRTLFVYSSGFRAILTNLSALYEIRFYRESGSITEFTPKIPNQMIIFVWSYFKEPGNLKFKSDWYMAFCGGIWTLQITTTKAHSKPWLIYSSISLLQIKMEDLGLSGDQSTDHTFPVWPTLPLSIYLFKYWRAETRQRSWGKQTKGSIYNPGKTNPS